MKTYAVIPARAGSKGFKDKNIRRIDGRPLIDFSISFAKKLKSVDRIFCSTDSQNYADIALECGAEVPFLRSEEAASDTAMEEHVLEDLRSKFRTAGIQEPDLIVWLRPTFCFVVLTMSRHVFKLIDDDQVTAARTVIQAENRLYNLKNGYLEPDFNDMGKSMIRRQDMESSYKVFSTDVFRFKGNPFNENFLGNNIKAFISASICGMDIDNEFDFKLVKLLLENYKDDVSEYLY